MTERSEQLKRGYTLSMFGGILIGASCVFEVIYILSIKDLSIFQEIVLTSQEKVFISLCMFLGLTATTLALAGAYFLWKGYPKAGGAADIVGSLLALSNIGVPFMYGYEVFYTSSSSLIEVSEAAFASSISAIFLRKSAESRHISSKNALKARTRTLLLVHRPVSF